jgi:hypothetical protein
MFGTVLAGLAGIYMLWLIRRPVLEAWRHDRAIILAVLWALLIGPALFLYLQ